MNPQSLWSAVFFVREERLRLKCESRVSKWEVREGWKVKNVHTADTLVPEVFLDISPYERAAREPQSGEHESRSGEKEKPLFTLHLNLTFMHTPAVKRVNLIIQKGTNGSLAITC